MGPAEIKSGDYQAAQDRALARLLAAVEKEHGPIDEGRRSWMCIVFANAFDSGFAFAAAHVQNWLESVPLVPIQFTPRPGPRRVP